MRERVQLVHQVRRRDIPIEHVPHEAAQVPVELAGEGRVEA